MENRKRLFPLEMGDGVMVYTLEELQENFDIVKAVEYAKDGRLSKWLSARDNNDIAQKINTFDKTAEDYPKEIYRAILGEEPSENITSQLKADLQRKEEIKKEEIKKEEERQLEIERKRIEEEGKREEQECQKEIERAKQPPMLIVNDEGLYSVDGNKLKYQYISAGDFGYAQEADSIYLIHTDEDNRKYFLYERKVNTREEKKIVETQKYIYGIRNHKLFMVCNNTDNRCIEIDEMDLDSHLIKSHKFKIKRELYRTDNYILLKPCVIDESGSHIYCCRGNDNYDGDYVADLNLEDDTIHQLVNLEGAKWVGNDKWGVGQNSFIVRGKGQYNNVRCIYYDVDSKQLCNLLKLEDFFKSFPNKTRYKVKGLCCDKGKIYFLIGIDTDDNLQYPSKYRLMEYDVKTGEIVERAYVTSKEIGKDLWLSVEDYMVINNNYIYVNGINNFLKDEYNKSLRFNMDTWKCEKLIKKDNEYIYVPI